MTVHIYNAWGRELCVQECRNGDDALSMLALYSQWDRAYLLTHDGIPVEMMVRT